MKFLKKKNVSKDQVDFSELNSKQKLNYLWDYYKWNAILVIVVGLILFFVIRHIVLYINPGLEIVLVNESAEKEVSRLITEYVEEYNYKPWDVTVEETNIGSKAEGNGGYGTEASLPLVVRLSFKMQDIVILPEEEFVDFASFGYLDDMSEVVGPELKDYLLEVTVIDNGDSKNFNIGETRPFGIKLSDLCDGLESDFGKDAVIALGVGAKHTEKSTEFIEYLAKK